MYKVIGNRASSILYSWLQSNNLRCNVLIPANICESIPSVYLKAGCNLHFCDVSKSDFMLDISQIEDSINDCNIGIIHYNHTYGYEDKFQKKIIKYLKIKYPHIIVVDDCCLCKPILTEPKHDIRDIVLYSTGHAKVVDISYGGYAFVNNKWKYKTSVEVYDDEDYNAFEKCVKRCHQNMSYFDISIFKSSWLNFECKYEDERYFEVVKEQYNKIFNHKKKLNRIYNVLPWKMKDGYNGWRFNILVENKEECIKYLFDNGLYCSSHYLSLGNGYFDEIKTPNCDYLHSHVINLFNDFCYTEEQAVKTVEILLKVARGLND